MKTYVKVTYVAINSDGKPIMTANTFDDLRKGLDEYYGIGTTDIDNAVCLGWYPYITKYGDDYEGCYEYKHVIPWSDRIEERVDEIKVYCTDYHPHTIYSRDDLDND
jgi:hypothetical protein